MIKSILEYNDSLNADDKAICNVIASTIDKALLSAEKKIWHAHPVWFLNGNPIVGYSKQKNGIRLMFWSGADFGEERLSVKGGKFKDASIFYNHISEVDVEDILRWLEKSIDIQWDYKNLIKRKGVLERLK